MGTWLVFARIALDSGIPKVQIVVRLSPFQLTHVVASTTKDYNIAVHVRAHGETKPPMEMINFFHDFVSAILSLL